MQLPLLRQLQNAGEASPNDSGRRRSLAAASLRLALLGWLHLFRPFHQALCPSRNVPANCQERVGWRCLVPRLRRPVTFARDATHRDEDGRTRNLAAAVRLPRTLPRLPLSATAAPAPTPVRHVGRAAEALNQSRAVVLGSHHPYRAENLELVLRCDVLRHRLAPGAELHVLAELPLRDPRFGREHLPS